MRFITADQKNMMRFRNDPRIMQALESVPGFNEAVAVGLKADVLLTEIEQQAESANLIDLDAIVSQGDIPDSWLESIGTNHLKAEIAERKLRLVRELRGRAAAHLESAAIYGMDEILSQLNSQLQPILASIEMAVAELGEAWNMAEAVDAGTAEAWRKLIQLRSEYNTLRASQQKVMAEVRDSLVIAKSSRTRDDRASETHIRNLDDIWPEWASPLDTTGQSIVPGINPALVLDRGEDSQPWPENDDEFMVWAVRNDVELWIPTIAQLRELSETRFERSFDREAARRSGWVN
ncbi:hypothetical protein [Nocardia sp. SYP-A9097]|uniref:hypothetical protein n=1 Tax=Nocardia sp. SYP-A9097 TaxID=2663237 RepID=UPI00129B4476|nr:hypothetical protein [Nocardia sp. SYP-A9097]